MLYRQLGKSGVRVSVVGIGTNRFGYERMPQEEVNRVIDAAADLGINFLDSADVYTNGRSEETIGVALKGRRHQFVIATKYYNKTGPGPNDWGASRLHLYEAVEASLRRLQTDHIDLYYVHNFDPTTPFEEMLRGLDDLIRAGKIRYIGASNFHAWSVAHANLLASMHGWSPFIVTQNHYHLLERGVEAEMLPFCRSQSVGLIPYFPLAGGFLTGKYRPGQPAPAGSRGESSPYVQKYMTPANYALIDRLGTWAQARGHTLGELAIAWLLAHPEVSSVISGVTRLEQLEANARAAEWVLTPSEVEEVERLLQPA
ncbi:predicted oxidoreductase related to aryl-alcohol dehydrogenases [Anaerolinea thermolimosa]|uniref:Predicted oxidoreductase related to aryl-alcohol dehydrogenases n=2 Tax=Anaerolinea thermolimosa TaxID=229919 RepID=A0A7U9KPD6_9CHLR|nr:aldo/keto reductase [Anaerolinea thermolimosa]GAP08683.1 predicted oxidoreductase related to aryl-alcohol dehydrogenases [Anaerolinea thermolimosa]